MTEHKIKWSHSSLKDYEGCARRYHEVKVLNNYPFQETEQTRYGKELHKAAEDYVKDGTPIPKQFEFVTPVIDALMAKPGRKFPEHEMGLTIDLKPCNFKDDAVWVRGIADLLIVDDENLTGWIIDYKTGNNRYPDTDQLVLMSLMTFAHFPHLRQVNSALLFVVKNTIVKYRMEVEDIEPAWWQYRQRVTAHNMNVNVLAACLTKLVQIKIKMERQTPERAKTLTMSHQYVKVANQFVTTCVLEVK
jgi:hypothetical protein